MTHPRSPRLIKGGIVLLDPTSAAVLRVIPLQYNPDALSRTLAIHTAGESGDRVEAMRLTGPPTETIKLDAEIDTTDQLEFPDKNPAAGQLGIFPQLAALETIVYPGSASLQSAETLARMGTLEIAPAEAPLTLFVWSKIRVLPVRITDFSITEEAFDPNLNPIRAKISLGMRVLSVSDLPSGHKGAGLFMAYLQTKEQLAARSPGAALGALGIGGIG
ncbi:hypothetical protein MZO42_19530 [Sphingomonas psychrotolerans]|uniref:Uncharacterized protein n=1 Tax=Sphingomonas psychrotolerans TaxID=1327635 RepID=A0ABU3N8U0_9SPHN|nr:hypothetical protein [Sphingomonas psychrotolerans]MDT8760897.1 hypothetical protein [Sphingomonas psychrotolerans]